jgi:hypothetical protein
MIPFMFEQLVTLPEAETLGYFYLELHGLSDWTFAIDILQTAHFVAMAGEHGLGGYAWHNEKRVAIDRRVLTSENPYTINDIILHEVAHALLPLKEQHSKRWALLALSVGVSYLHMFPYLLDLGIADSQEVAIALRADPMGRINFEESIAAAVGR